MFGHDRSQLRHSGNAKVLVKRLHIYDGSLQATVCIEVGINDGCTHPIMSLEIGDVSREGRARVQIATHALFRS